MRQHIFTWRLAIIPKTKSKSKKIFGQQESKYSEQLKGRK